MDSNKKMSRVIVLLASIVTGIAMSGLHAEEGAAYAQPIKAEYNRPGSDFSVFHSLLINDLDVANSLIVPPPWKADKPFHWNISDKNIGALQAAFQASMRDQISANNGYPIVSEPGPGVIELSVRIVSFMPYANRDEKVTTRGSGELRIHVEVRNAQNKELIAMYEGPQEVGQEYRTNSDFTRMENLKALFDFWGYRIRVSMDNDHGRN